MVSAAGVRFWIGLIVLVGLVGTGLACSAGGEEIPDEAVTSAERADTARAPEHVLQPTEPLEPRTPTLLPAPPDTLADGRNVAQRLDDLSLAARIRKALVEEPTLRRFDFEADVVRGRAILYGKVETSVQQNRALELARRIEGVRDVVSEVVATEEPELEEEALSEVVTKKEAAGKEKTESQATAPPAVPSRTFHTVKSGESLWTIARAYDTSIRQVKQLNDLQSNRIKPGQRLRVK